jgi:hypothetical protein
MKDSPDLEFGNIVPGVFTPVLAKHSKSFSLIDCVSVGVDRMQRNFEPMRKQVEAWQSSELTDGTAKVVIYEAFVEGKLEAPKHLARTVHDLYIEPRYEEFQSRTIWSLSNAFTSAFKEPDPIPQFRTPASWESSWRLGSRNPSSCCEAAPAGPLIFCCLSTPFCRGRLRGDRHSPYPN